MGDRTWVEFTIRECDHTAFCSVSEWSISYTTTKTTTNNEEFATYFLDEVNYGDPGLDEVCWKNHIPYDIAHGSGDEYSAGGSSLRFDNEGIGIQTMYSNDSQAIDLTYALSVLRALTLSDKEKVKEILRYAEQKETLQVPIAWDTQEYNVSIAKAKQLIGAE